MADLKRANALDETAQKFRISIADIIQGDGGPMPATTAPVGGMAAIIGAWSTGGHKLQGEAANNNSKTSDVRIRLALPLNYKAASNIDVKVQHRVTVVANSTATIDAQAYKSNGQGGVTGGDNVTTGPFTNNTTSWVEQTFTITGTSLNPGDELEILLRCVTNDTGGANNSRAEIGGVTFTTTTMM